MKKIQLQRIVWRLLILMGVFCPLAMNAQNIDDTGALDPVINGSNDDAIVFASVRSVGSGDIDAQFSFKSSETTASGWDQFAGIIRFIDGQVFDARDGGTYTYVDEIAYDFSESYYIWTVIHFATKTYDVHIQPVSKGTTYTIAEGYGWRDGGDLEVPSIDTWVASNNNEASNLVVGAVEYVSNVGDVPAAVSDASLTDLSVDVAEISPAFDPTTTSYTATIPAGISEFTIAATPSGRGAFVTGDSTITVATEGGIIDIIVVSEDSTAEKTYTIEYTVAADNSNATLASLTTDVGSFSPAFDPGTLQYVLNVPASATTINITATPAGAEATVSGGGEIDITTLTGPIEIIVTAEDGATTLTYTIEVSSLELKHSYTFDNGTAEDEIGDADGALMGGAISGGRYVASTNGEYVELPAADIAINTYSELTLEAYVVAGTANATHTMMSYFGNTEGSYGVNYLFQALANGGNSKTSISCLNTASPWSAETGVTGELLEDGGSHHLVTTLSDSEISWYIDGELVGSAMLAPDNKIANLSNELAYLCKGGYTGDATWIGAIDEFNIYEGLMDASTISESASAYLSDATLSSITVDKGVLEPAFDPTVDTYSVTVPSGTTTVNVSAVPNSPNATVAGDGDVDISSPTVIDVTAVNGESTAAYTINWEVTEAAKDATLSELVPTAGTLEPVFNPALTSYSIVLPYGTQTLNFTTTASAEGATISGNDPLDVSSGNGTYEVTVTSPDESETMTYTVDVAVDVFALKSLTIGGIDFNGNVVTGTLDQELDLTVTDYSATLPAHTVEAFISSVVTNDSSAFIELPDTVDISGGSVTVPLVITSENLETSITYNITLQLAAGVYNTSSGLFEPPLTGTDHVIYSRIDITENGVAIDGLFAFSNGEVRDWGQTSGGIRFTQSDGVVQLRDGANYLPIPEEGTVPVLYDTTYHCWIKISPADTMYSVYVQMEGAANHVTIGENARFRFQTNTIDRWIALSASGSSQGLNVRRVELVDNVGDIPAMGTEATLSGITLGAGSLSPAFDPSVTTYDIVVPFGTESVMVSATATDKWATVEGAGDVVIDAGSGTATFLVRAEDTTVTKTYTLDFTEANEASDASLASLTVDVGELSPSFNPAVTEYELTVPYGTTTVNINTETNVASASVAGDEAIDVSAGGTIPVDVVVTAEDGSTTETYTVTIVVEEASSDATLTFLRVDAGTLDPAFDPAITSYALEVPFGTESVKVTYKPADLNASVTITSDGIIPVSVGTTSTAEVLVTAEDGTTTNSYIIGITVTDPSPDATLSALSVEADGATISPEFDPAVFNYALDVPYGVDEVIVTATASHHGATVSGDGAIDVSSGSATATIVVTAEDESTETYTIEMTVLDASTDATLSDLFVEGGTLEPAFSPEVFEYISVVPLGTTTANVSATLSFDRASMTGSGAIDVISGSGEANIVVTAEDGTTTNTYHVVVYVGSKPDNELGLEDDLISSVKVFPNPSSSYVEVNLDQGKLANPTMIIYDVDGRSYFTKRAIRESSIKIDLSKFKSGLYFVRIEGDGFSLVRRFIKLK